jgi:hypothetical protein
MSWNPFSILFRALTSEQLTRGARNHMPRTAKFRLASWVPGEAWSEEQRYGRPVI